MGRILREILPSGYDYDDDEIVLVQRLVSVLLYISLICHGVGEFLTILEAQDGLDPALRLIAELSFMIPALRIIAIISITLFFVAECLLLPAVGILIMTAVSAVLFWIFPHFVLFLVQALLYSILLFAVGGIIAALSVGLVVVAVDGIIVAAVITPLIVTPYLAGAGVMGIPFLLGAGAAAGIDAGVRQVRPVDLMRPARILINLFLVFVVVWPVLTWGGVFQGVFALKPVQRAQREHVAFSEENASFTYEQFFDSEREYSYTMNGTKNWTFGENFYESYIYPGRNTFAQGEYPGASNDTYAAFGLNGMVYLFDVEANETNYYVAYTVEPKDAMVLVGKELFIFGDDKIVLLGPKGCYLWEDTEWASEYGHLSEEEQYERLYGILEKQNDGKSETISIEDVAVVARAQRTGQLLYYDAADHSAYFGQKGEKGEITILCQSAKGIREASTSFTPNCESENLPYTMLNADMVAYIDYDKIIFQGVKEDWTTVHYTNKSHDGETHPFVSFHVLHDAEGNEYYAYQDNKDIICLERLGKTVIEAHCNAEEYEAVYSVGTDIFRVAYDSNNILNRFTYIKDLREGQEATEVRTEKWKWSRVQLADGLWEDEDDKEAEPPRELSFVERYPITELNGSAKQVGMYMDNVVSPSQYDYYIGPAEQFYFRVPRVLYGSVNYTYIEDGEEVTWKFHRAEDSDSTTEPLQPNADGTYAEDGSEVRIHYYCENETSSMTVTLRPNAEGTDNETLSAALQKSAEEEMVNVKVVRSGYADEEGT
ncbi:MAG: hypothetical protein IJ374_06575, partial [Lachnospiraceae bacterium]|nr:hypothetical protein [Lachnospiraceae bacterium]